jgi:hypothetical protein
MPFIYEKANLEFWDKKDFFTIEETAYLFQNLEPQYKNPHPKRVMSLMKTFIRREEIFGTPIKKMRYSVRHRRYVTFYKIPESEPQNCADPDYGPDYVAYSTEDVTLFPRSELLKRAIELNRLRKIPFLQTPEQRALAAISAVDPELTQGSTVITSSGTPLNLPHLNEKLLALKEILWEYWGIYDTNDPPKQYDIQKAIDAKLGYNKGTGGKNSRNAIAIASLFKPDNIKP